jgi:hypothetical protein
MNDDDYFTQILISYRTTKTDESTSRALLRLYHDIPDLHLRQLADGTTLLHVACERGELSIVQDLVNLGADINAKIRTGPLTDYTPLHRACQKGSLEIVKYLLEAQHAKIQRPLLLLAGATVSKNEDLIQYLSLKLGSQHPKEVKRAQTALAAQSTTGRLGDDMSQGRHCRRRIQPSGEDSKSDEMQDISMG